MKIWLTPWHPPYRNVLEKNYLRQTECWDLENQAKTIRNASNLSVNFVVPTSCQLSPYYSLSLSRISSTSHSTCSCRKNNTGRAGKHATIKLTEKPRMHCVLVSILFRNCNIQFGSNNCFPVWFYAAVDIMWVKSLSDGYTFDKARFQS